MKFRVGRASYRAWRDGADKPPCGGAIPEPPDEYGNRRWSIEVADLPALMAFCDVEGEIILSAPAIGQPDDLPSITIYDNYIE